MEPTPNQQGRYTAWEIALVLPNTVGGMEGDRVSLY
jgi:hypothetical protein